MATARTFPTGGTVQREDLVDREAVLSELFERTFNHRNSVLLSAPRQTGKTSVAEELLRRVRAAGGWGIYIDCSAATEERDLAELIAHTTYDQATGSKGAFARLKDLISSAPKPVFFQSDMDLSLAFFGGGRQESTSRLIERAFGLADDLAAQKGKPCVVVYDEFQRLQRVSSTLTDRVRAILQHKMTNTAYVFMGSEVGLLNELFKDPKRMPFRLATPLDLSLPSREAWHLYIAGRFKALHVAIDNEEIEAMVDFAGCHPRDLMEVCEQLLVLRSVAPRALKTLELAQERTMEGLRAPFEEIWKRLERPKGTWTTAARIAHGQAIYGRGRSQMLTARTLTRLEDEGVIRKSGRGSYEFTEPLFGVFVRELTRR